MSGLFRTPGTYVSLVRLGGGERWIRTRGISRRIAYRAVRDSRTTKIGHVIWPRRRERVRHALPQMPSLSALPNAPPRSGHRRSSPTPTRQQRRLGRFRPFVKTEPAQWEKLIAINLTGALHMHHAVLPGMAARKSGRIVNIASDAARVRLVGRSRLCRLQGRARRLLEDDRPRACASRRNRKRRLPRAD